MKRLSTYLTCGSLLGMTITFMILLAVPSAATQDGSGTYPTVVSTTPVHNAEDIPADTVITVVFSKDMNASTLNESSVRAFNPMDGDVFVGEIAYHPETRTLTFRPTGEVRDEGGGEEEEEEPSDGGFHYGARIQFVVSSTAEDTDGNGLDGQGIGRPSDFILVFTVEKAPVDNSPGKFIPAPGPAALVIAVVGAVVLVSGKMLRKERP